MPLRRLSTTTRDRVLFVWLVIFTALTFVVLEQNRRQADENHRRVAEIQESRIVSCRQTYEGVREVFTPFFPPEDSRTEAQQNDVELFNQTVDRLKAGCASQTKPEVAE